MRAAGSGQDDRVGPVDIRGSTNSSDVGLEFNLVKNQVCHNLPSHVRLIADIYLNV